MGQDDEVKLVGVKEFHVAKALMEGYQEHSDNMDSNVDQLGRRSVVASEERGFILRLFSAKLCTESGRYINEVRSL